MYTDKLRHYKRGQTYQQGTSHVYTLQKITSERGQTLYKGQNSLSQLKVSLGSTVL